MGVKRFYRDPIGGAVGLIHYFSSIVSGQAAEDLTGTELVSSTWVERVGTWQLMFNQD